MQSARNDLMTHFQPDDFADGVPGSINYFFRSFPHYFLAYGGDGSETTETVVFKWVETDEYLVSIQCVGSCGGCGWRRIDTVKFKSLKAGKTQRENVKELFVEEMKYFGSKNEVVNYLQSIESRVDIEDLDTLIQNIRQDVYYE